MASKAQQLNALVAKINGMEVPAVIQERRQRLADIAECEIEVKAGIQEMERGAVRIGRALLRAERLMSDVEFLKWRKKEFPKLGTGQVRTFLAVARICEKCDIEGVHLSLNVWEVITKWWIPEDARGQICAQVFEMSRQGDTVTTATLANVMAKMELPAPAGCGDIPFFSYDSFKTRATKRFTKTDDASVRTDVDTPYGTADVVTDAEVIVFEEIRSETDLKLALAEVLILRGWVAPQATPVIYIRTGLYLSRFSEMAKWAGVDVRLWAE